MQGIPSEFMIGGVYMPPLLIASLLGTVIAMLAVKLLNRYRLARFFYYPPLVFVGFVVIFTCLVGTLLVPF